MPAITLKYFNIKGRGDAIRLALELSGAEYTDERFGFDKWPAIKAAGIADGSIPFGQLPQLTFDGFNLVQSLTILRFIGHKFNLEGSDEHSIYFGQMIMDSFEDFIISFFKAAFSPNKEEDLKKFYETSFVSFMTAFEKLFDTYEGKYWLGDKATVVDCLAYSILDQIVPAAPCTKNYPKVIQSMKDFEQVEQIKKYLESGRRE
ncbi:hypothetical protein WA158_005091 [Blastocystis sp. Blastoise]